MKILNGQPLSYWKRRLRLIIFIIAISLTLVFLVGAWLSWSGRREWLQTKNELLARGEKLSIYDFLPAPVPAGQNFFNDPVWMELTDTVDSTGPFGLPQQAPRLPLEKRQLSRLNPPLTGGETALIQERYPGTDCTQGRVSAARVIFNKFATAGPEQKRRDAASFALQLLAPSAPMVSHLADLETRPMALFPARFEDDFFTAMPHFSYLMQDSQILALRARASLELGNPVAAADDVRLLLRLPYTLQAEPILISLLVRVTMISLAITGIDEGIKTHQWDTAALRDFETTLSRFDLIRDLARSLRAERGAFNNGVERISKTGDYRKVMTLTGMEDGRLPGQLNWHLYGLVFFRSDQALYNRLLQQEIDSFDEASRHGFLNDTRPSEMTLLRVRSDHFKTARHIFSLLAFPTLELPERRMVLAQDLITQARIACALERYYLRNGSYPGSLTALLPDFLPEIPKDILTGKPMIYRRTAPDKFLLYSVGWDRLDDGGVAVKRGQTSGDWVWGQPLY